MQSELQRVLELQSEYSPRLAPAMSERGLLVRDAIPVWLRDHADSLEALLKVDDFFAEGRDGTGLKTRVPWIRFGSRARSPRATEGFYVVYLFDALGQGVYLSLNQGTTDFRDGDFVPKPPEDILERVAWARQALDGGPLLESDLGAQMDLNDPGLGAGYVLGNVASVGYELNSVPDDDGLLTDARRFAEGLAILYREHDRAPLPKEQPEVREAVEAAERAVGKSRRGKGAGFRTNSAEIRAVERQAIKLASAYYAAQGFSVKELGKPFDLEVKKDDLTLTVEVKGTTSDGTGVVLTGGEVRHHEKAFPDNALVVVRNIVLQRGRMPHAFGGHLYELRGWDIEKDSLQTISYTYVIPPTMYDHAGVPSEDLL